MSNQNKQFDKEIFDMIIKDMRKRNIISFFKETAIVFSIAFSILALAYYLGNMFYEYSISK